MNTIVHNTKELLNEINNILETRPLPDGDPAYTVLTDFGDLIGHLNDTDIFIVDALLCDGKTVHEAALDFARAMLTLASTEE